MCKPVNWAARPGLQPQPACECQHAELTHAGPTRYRPDRRARKVPFRNFITKTSPGARAARETAGIAIHPRAALIPKACAPAAGKPQPFLASVPTRVGLHHCLRCALRNH
jgi:hypothetical protein